MGCEPGKLYLVGPSAGVSASGVGPEHRVDVGAGRARNGQVGEAGGSLQTGVPTPLPEVPEGATLEK